MYDINYFSVLKRIKQKNKNAKIVFIVFFVLLVAANAILLSTGWLAMRKLQTHINTNKAYVSAPATKAKVRDAAILDKELSVASEYLTAIEKTADKIAQTDLIKVALIDHVRSLAPLTTYFETVEMENGTIKLDCISSLETDALLFYNRLLSDNQFSSAYLSEFIVVPEAGTVTFIIDLTLRGGEPS